LNDSLFNCLRDRKIRHCSILQSVSAWFKNRSKYSTFTISDIQSQIKKSDTIFVLGTGASINNISESRWNSIREHDSIGMNWWPLHNFVPTYYHSEYPHKNTHFNYFKKILGPKLSERYENTLFFISGNRAARRGVHPRVIPELFPKKPKIYFYEYLKPLKFNDPSELTSESFERTLFYRGSLTAVLDIISKIGYKKIVLLGVDLKKWDYFYDNHPEIKKMWEAGYGRPPSQRENCQHLTSTEKPNKIAIQDYLSILNDKYYKPNNIKLYCGDSNSLLAENLPLYF